ncbi:hypothetical protein SDC9_131830 [bioreactor metagenome]|uniref:Uncharacterized protein n=1 Tax=bioreactor metagenome TaxID=1076179 RepID=A0A645D606_9ZZZZ
MSLRLRPLGHNAHLEPLCHAHNAVDHAVGPLIGADAPDKTHVQLQGGHRHVHQHIQRGVSAAEVVDQHGKARRVQLLRYVQHLLGIIHIGALRYLNMESGRVNTVLFCHARQQAAHIRIVNVESGHVGGDRQSGIARRLEFHQVLKYGFPDVLVQPGDKAVALKNGYKLIGRNQPPLRVNPAYQSLRRHRRVGRQTEDRLEINLKLALFQRLVHLGRHLLLPAQAAAQLLVVERHALITSTGNRLLGNLRAVTDFAHRKRQIVNLIDAAANVQPVFQVQAAHQLRPYLTETVQLQLLHAAQHHESISAYPSHAGHAFQLGQPCRQISQEPIPRCPSEKVVEHFKAIHI